MELWIEHDGRVGQFCTPTALSTYKQTDLTTLVFHAL
jgi:hypothetical protein